MGLGLLYWILMLIWLIFSVWWHWPGRGDYGYWPAHAFIYVLMLILGWATFGAPVRG